MRAIALILLIFLGLVFDPRVDVSAQPQPPIVDLHFHPQSGWDLGALVGLMDQLGVVRAGNGPGGPDILAWDYVRRYPKKFIAFCALGELIFHLQEDGSGGYPFKAGERTIT